MCQADAGRITDVLFPNLGVAGSNPAGIAMEISMLNSTGGIARRRLHANDILPRLTGARWAKRVAFQHPEGQTQADAECQTCRTTNILMRAS